MSVRIFHSGPQRVEIPDLKIRNSHPKDFGWGFYCTRSEKQAKLWALRALKMYGTGFLNCYDFDESRAISNLRDGYLRLNVTLDRHRQMTDIASNNWLNFIVACRQHKDTNSMPHKFDIVEGPMADDKVWEYISEYLRYLNDLAKGVKKPSGLSVQEFWKKATFNTATNQICFHTERSLNYLKFLEAFDMANKNNRSRMVR